MVNNSPQFIPNQSEIIAPLRNLLKKDSIDLVPGILRSSRAFEGHPVKLVTLQVDTSKSGLGACILKDGHPIAYASRSLIQAKSGVWL